MLTFGSLGVEPRTWFNYDIDSVHLDMPFTGIHLDMSFTDIIAQDLSDDMATVIVSLDEIDGLDDVIEVVFVKPEVDGTSPS